MTAINVLSEQAERTEKTLNINLRSTCPGWTLRTRHFLGEIA